MTAILRYRKKFFACLAAAAFWFLIRKAGIDVYLLYQLGLDPTIATGAIAAVLGGVADFIGSVVLPAGLVERLKNADKAELERARGDTDDEPHFS